jgi:hypothetical protein
VETPIGGELFNVSISDGGQVTLSMPRGFATIEAPTWDNGVVHGRFTGIAPFPFYADIKMDVSDSFVSGLVDIFDSDHNLFLVTYDFQGARNVK